MTSCRDARARSIRLTPAILALGMACWLPLNGAIGLEPDRLGPRQVRSFPLQDALAVETLGAVRALFRIPPDENLPPRVTQAP